MPVTYDKFLSLRPRLTWSQSSQWTVGKGSSQRSVWEAKKANDPIPWFLLEVTAQDQDNSKATLYANVLRNRNGQGKQVVESSDPMPQATLFKYLASRYGVESRLDPMPIARHNPLRTTDDIILSQDLVDHVRNYRSRVMLTMVGNNYQVHEMRSDGHNRLLPDGDIRLPVIMDPEEAKEAYQNHISRLQQLGFVLVQTASTRRAQVLPPGPSLEGNIGSSSVDISQISSAFAGAGEALKMAQQYDSSLFLDIACIFQANGPFYGVYIPAVDQAKHLESTQAKLRSEGYTIQSQPDGSFRAWSPDPEVMPEEIQQHINELDRSNKMKGGNVFGINVAKITAQARQNAMELSPDPKQQEVDFLDIAVLQMAATMVHEAVHARTVATRSVSGNDAVESLRQRYGGSQGEAPSEAAQRTFMAQAMRIKNQQRATKNLPPLNLSGATIHATQQAQMTKEAGKGSGCVMAMLPSLSKLPNLIRDDDLYTEEDDKGRETETHVTILYGLDPSVTSSECKKVLEPWLGKVTEITLGSVSVFENDDFDVAKIDVEITPDLAAMNQALKTLPLNNTKHPDYHPHVTLAYCQKQKGKNYIGLKMPGSAKISRVVFSSVEGHYTTLWKSPEEKQAGNWYAMTRQAQFGAQFSYPNSQEFDVNWASAYWGGHNAAIETMLEMERINTEESTEHVEKRMRAQDTASRKEIVDPLRSTESLLDADRDPAAAYHSIEEAMETRRPKPLLASANPHLQKTAFNYVIDPQVDIDSHHGPNSNMDYPMSVRVQTDFDDGLFMTWDECDDGEQDNPDNFRRVRRQERYRWHNKRDDWQWVEPRFAPTSWSEESLDGSPAKRFQANDVRFLRFASVVKSAMDLHKFLDIFKDKSDSKKLSGVRLVLGLLTLQQIMRALEGKTKVHKVSDDGERAVVWVANQDISEDQIQRAESYVSGTEISESTRQAFDAITSVGRRQQETATDILHRAREIANDLDLDGVYLIGGFPRALMLEEPWCEVSLMEFSGVSTDQVAKLASALAEHYQAKQHYDVATSTISMVVNGMTCLFRWVDDAAQSLSKDQDHSNLLLQDVFRRLITADMLILWLKDGRVYDPTRMAENDILEGIVRTHKDPVSAISENPMSILNAIRCAIHHAWTIDPALAKAIGANENALLQIPGINDALLEIGAEGIGFMEKTFKQLGLKRLFDLYQGIKLETDTAHACSNQTESTCVKS